jgi:L-aspartate oxidase
MAMAYRAGAVMADLEFVQFHPTTLFSAGAPRFLLSEALRGEGAVLRNGEGERFMARYHPDGELAPRDVVSRSIVQEMERTGDSCVFLDLTGRDSAALRARFPRIYETCLRFGFDLARDRVPVHPSAHYFMGGVRTDLFGRTSVAGLYAAGEVACTGVHGANRLASNSLLEGVVFGARAAGVMLAETQGAKAREARLGASPLPALAPVESREIAASLAGVMWIKAGIRREARALASALELIGSWESSLRAGPMRREGIETRNLILLAGLVCGAALRREESRGAHFRSDFPARREEWRKRLEMQAPSPAADLPRLR